MSAETIGNIIDLCSLLVVVIASVVAIRQLKAMRHGGGGANVMPLWDRLQSDAARANRRTLYQTYRQRGPYQGQWTDAEVQEARSVCAMLSVTGRLAMTDVVPLDLVVAEWGGAVRHAWQCSAALIAAERSAGTDPELFESFRWLASKCGAVAELPAAQPPLTP